MRPLEIEESERYVEGCEHLHDFEQTRDLLALVSANLDELRTELGRFATEARTATRGVLAQDPTDRRRLQRVAVNFLNAVRLYLDHRQTHLTRRYGDTSKPLLAYNETRRRLHQTVPEFSFVYELRNFVQHCGMPLQVLRANQRIVRDETSERMEADVLVGCSRAELLSRFDGWTNSRHFIESRPDEFALYPILARMLECLTSVETATMNAIMPGLWNDARYVVRLLSDASDDRHIGLVADFKGHPEQPSQTSASFCIPPFVVLEWLRLIRQTAGPPGYQIVHAHLALPAPPRVT